MKYFGAIKIDEDNFSFIFKGKYSDKDKNCFKKAQIEDFKRICEFLKTDPDQVGKIRFFVFDSLKAKREADPHHSISRASARFNSMTIYRFWLPDEDPHFPHEITHLVSYKWGRPYYWQIELDAFDGSKVVKRLKMVSTSFMQEGLAIAVDDIVFNRELMEDNQKKFIDDWCREQIDKIPSLIECINFDGFCSFENKVVVPFAASFSKFLLINYGIDKYKTMYIRLKETQSAQENIKIIEKIYQRSINRLIKKWRQSLFEGNLI